MINVGKNRTKQENFELMLQHTKALYIHQLWKLDPFQYSFDLPLLPHFFLFQQRSTEATAAEVRESHLEFSLLADKSSILMYNKQKEWQSCVSKSVPSCSTHELFCLGVSEKMSLAGEKFLVSLYPPFPNYRTTRNLPLLNTMQYILCVKYI